MEYLLLRLKSTFQHWPSDLISKEGFYSKIRGTESFPTERALYGMIECALGMNDDEYEKKASFEKKVCFGSPIRTPFLYYSNYEEGRVYDDNSWYSKYLGIKFTGDKNIILYKEAEKKENDYEYVSPLLSKEFTAKYSVTPDGITATNEECKPSATMSLYVLADWVGDIKAASETLHFKEVSSASTLVKESIGNFELASIIDAHNSLSFYSNKDSRMAIAICMTYDDTSCRKVLFERLQDKGYKTKARTPYKRYYNLTTASRMSDQKYPTADGKGKDANPTMTKHVYLTDADFLVPVYGDREVLEEIEEYLDVPRYSYYFGKKPCWPRCRVSQGIKKD